jgi:cation:H+ antiporter
MLGSALLFTALALSGEILRWQGVLMFAALVVFSLYAYISERRRRSHDGAAELVEEFEEGPKSLWLALLSVAGGIGSVVLGAKLLVTGAIVMARYFGVGEEVIGLTIVAVGTSLPELATAVVAALRRHSDVAVGNIIGANIYNLLAIMGLVSAVTPLKIPPQILRFDLWFMLAVTVAMLAAVLFRGKIDRMTAGLFLATFAAYTAMQYYGIDRILH